MKNIYPAIKPYKTGYLSVSNIHSIYYEESGNPKGLPIVVLHGGPGSQSKAKHRRAFDPKKYRIILFDQRGCGKSKPRGELKQNTTWDLVEDMEKLRQFLDLKKWHVYGFSWGSTLALAYAEKYPRRVSALIVGGIFTFNNFEISWGHDDQAKIFYPDAWQVYSKNIKKNISKNLLNIFYKKIFSNNKKISAQAVYDFYYWDSFRMDLIPKSKMGKNLPDENTIANAKIYFHYAKHKGFLKNDQLIKNAKKLKNIPGVILQGRYDMVCPPITAWRLHHIWTKADFHIIENTNHKTTPAMLDKIITYTKKFAKIIK